MSTQVPRAESLPGMNTDALAEWLTGSSLNVSLPLRVEFLSGGRSNLTFRVTDGAGNRYALRRPPLRTVGRRSHDVLREYEILQALAGAHGVPAPAPVAACADPDVLGAPFYLMRFIDGQVLAGPAEARTLAASARARAGHAAAEVLARLHTQDVDAIGLSGMRRPDGLVERQLRRWVQQVEALPSADVQQLQRLGTALSRKVPPPQRTCLVHGDYKLGNLVVDPDGDLVGVLDWELAAIGDPLVDLGWLIASWGPADDDRQWVKDPATVAGGFPDAGSLIDRYVDVSGLDATALTYYIAFAHWRWSCINTTTIARFAAGAMGSKHIDEKAMRGQITWQLDAADQLLRQAS